MTLTSTAARVPGWHAYDLRDFAGQVLVHIEAASEQEALTTAQKIRASLDPTSPPVPSGNDGLEVPHDPIRSAT